ncbi:MAG TPA: hypothetical protein VHN39_03080 [Phenylobacterium sp.]|jgi:hypothetical protein|nr:hypothetical protein [Phenylobacterium sp.]
MSRIIGRLTLAAGLAGALAAGSGAGAAVPSATFRVTNASNRVVECNLLVDGKTRTYLKVHVGKTYFDDFTVGRQLQLVCMRGVEGVYGPLKLGVDYRFVERDGHHVAVVEGAAQ